MMRKNRNKVRGKRKLKKRTPAEETSTCVGEQVNTIMTNSSLKHEIENFILKEAQMQARALRRKKLGYVCICIFFGTCGWLVVSSIIILLTV